MKLNTIGVIASLAACAAAAAQGRPVANEAEYALRWSAKQGGPSNATSVSDLLGIKGGPSRLYEVRYFDVLTPRDAPRGTNAILRERSSGSKVEITWKYRSADAGTDDNADASTTAWTCPLRMETKRKEEMDISLLPSGAVKRSFSRSCSSTASFAQAVAPTLQARQRGCVSKVVRIEAKKEDLKVEEWRLPDGTVFIELSWKAQDTPADLGAFKRYVEVLTKAGAVPLDRSKTDIGTRCTAR